MKKVTIIDYGMSNLLSISRAIEKLGTEVIVTADADEIAIADQLILPGVGSFYEGMGELVKRNIPEAIHKFISTGKPFLGICLGMQMMLGEGTEVNQTKGLDIIPGKVLPLPEKNKEGIPNKIPHIGWSSVNYNSQKSSSILENFKNSFYMYFVHSYYALPDLSIHSAAVTDFNDMTFTCIINKDNAWGTQFHPEKSGEQGLELLKSFINL